MTGGAILFLSTWMSLGNKDGLEHKVVALSSNYNSGTMFVWKKLGPITRSWGIGQNIAQKHFMHGLEWVSFDSQTDNFICLYKQKSVNKLCLM